MDQDRVYLLLAKYVAGEATAEELEELEWAFVANPGLRKLAGLLPGVQQAPPKGVSEEEEKQMLERGLKHIRKKSQEGEALPLRALPVVRRIGEEGGRTEEARQAEEEQQGGDERIVAKEKVVRRRWPFRWVAAASVLILVGGGLLYYRAEKPSAERVQPVAILTAGRGSRKFAKLPDGSKLWLNAGSRIVLAAGFANDKRELTLEGEAFFDVKHDEQHPFIIHTGALEIRVLGTSLDVRAYPGEASMETTLIEGRAEIGLAGNPQSAILLHPNEKVIIPNDGPGVFGAGGSGKAVAAADSDRGTDLPVNYIRRPIVPDQTDGTIAETSWTNNKLVFRKETLAGMTARLERWYDVKIVFGDNLFQQDTISGTFPNVPITDVMHALQITVGFHYSIAKDTIKIW